MPADMSDVAAVFLPERFLSKRFADVGFKGLGRGFKIRWQERHIDKLDYR